MMGREIKTRHVNKDVKVLDKTVVAKQHMKQVYVNSKENVKQEQAGEPASPVEYAEDNVRNAGKGILHEMAYQSGKQGRKAVNVIKVKSKTIRKSEKNVPHSFSEGSEKELPPSEVHKKKQVQSSQLSVRPSDRQSKRAVEAVNRTEKAVKITGNNTVKYADKAVKTTEKTNHMGIKTTQDAVKYARMTAKASVKMTEKSVQATRQAVKAAGQSVRVSAKAAASAVKAMIATARAWFTGLAAGGGIIVFILLMVVLFGGVLFMVGGGNSASVTPVSAEVEAYTPLIRQYANQYGIGEYVELIKAVMMQESGGRGLDPMQCSEGSFNTRYPKTPNGITNPEYSIACGVQEIRAVLLSAEVESPVDMEHIKLALQGYNFGNGYIQWAKSHYGGYTVANAVQFSDMMARRMGWSAYGDRQYVSHVLRYYAFGRIPTGAGNQAIVQVALSQVGNSGDIYWSWYGFNSRVEWCACFVSWCADQCGYIEKGILPKFSLCSEGVKWFESRGQFRDGSYVPAAGDLIFFDWGNDGTIDHVGIVENVTDGRVNTVEGNSGDRCERLSYVIGDNRVYGYGIFKYWR